MRRVNEAVKQVLAGALADLKDPRVGFVTLTDVRTSPDLARAEVFYTVLPDDPEARARTAAGLRSAAPLLRRELGARQRLRRVPELVFTHDPVPEHGRRIESLLRGETRPGGGDPDDHPRG
ncbi:MAG: 30S ribosome-binding factor RbfA [Actinobacteria bacterium]|nr:30S ribosome-binding factor RbfA [Actinomycetota bacterium]